MGIFFSNWFYIFCLAIFVFPRLSDAKRKPDEVCKSWFAEQNDPTHPESCLLKCQEAFDVSMGSFQCLNQCEALCEDFIGQDRILLAKILYYPGLTKAERILVTSEPKKALVVFIQKTRAEFSSRKYFTEIGSDDESDAFRHFLWAGLLTKELGEEEAKRFLDAHEQNPAQAEAERGMDLSNNRAGILAANKLIRESKFDLNTFEKLALDELRSGNLVVLRRKQAIHRRQK
jgi:hypothetical protein